MLSDYPAVAARRVEVELLSHEVAETGGVQVGAGADDAVAGETAQLPGHVGQNVHCSRQGTEGAVRRARGADRLRMPQRAPHRGWRPPSGCSWGCI